MSDLRQQLQETLGAAYALERELLGGGMSRVFVATDAALNRRVVIKVLSPELSQGISAERFAREIKVAAALQDPHILPVHSAGQSGGLPFYTMPFVEGESLRGRLLRGPMPFNEAVGILRDVALALEYAHGHGVVHRDIKPENVLLAGRTAVVADFGIAKAVSAARTGAPEVREGTLTSIGQSLGTPAYMAPEQVAGETIDHRSDLYAWGVMAYEVLAGRHPFADKTSAAKLMAAQLSERPALLGETKPGIAPPIAALVMQCLEKEPAQRPQNAGDVLAALDAIHSPSAARTTAPAVASRIPLASRRPLGISLAVAGVALAALTIFLFQRDKAPASESAAPASDARTIAVLPFENLGDSADAYFADGITDAVRGKLTSLPGLAVIARGSSDQYGRTTKLPHQIANELGVRYLLSGKVRFAGAGDARRVQVSPELVEIADGQPQSRWQEPFDAEIRDVFRVQGDIAGKVAEAMRLALGSGTQQQLAQAVTNNPAAYDAYLRGEAAAVNNDPAGLRRAISFYEQAVGHDSTMAEAWGALSRNTSLLYSNSTPTSQLQQRALQAARRALALEPNGAAGLRAMGIYHRVVARNLGLSLEQYELARRAAPTSATILAELANTKHELGRFDESVRDRETSIRLDPRNGRLLNGQTLVLLRLRRIAEARSVSERAVALAPTSLVAMMARLLTEAASGNLAGARQVIVAASSELPSSRVLAYVGTYWDMGWVLDSANSQQLLTFGPDAYDNDRGQWSIVRAQQYQLLGDTVQARILGEAAARVFDEQLLEAPRDPQRHVLRGLALAFAGRGREALAESARGLNLARADTAATWALSTAYLTYVAARTALVAGDKGKAFELLSESMRLRYFVTPAWLRIDPTWNAVRDDPRFARIVSGS